MNIFTLRNFVGACGGIAGLCLSNRAYQHWYSELPKDGGKSWPSKEAYAADKIYSHAIMMAAPFVGVYLGAVLGRSVVKPIKDAVITALFRKII